MIANVIETIVYAHDEPEEKAPSKEGSLSLLGVVRQVTTDDGLSLPVFRRLQVVTKTSMI